MKDFYLTCFYGSFMSIKLQQIQDYLRIPYKHFIGDHDYDLSLVVDDPVSLSISKMPPPYSHQDFERGVWKPVIHFHLNYDIGLENLTLCRFRDRICESKVSFLGNNAEIVNGSGNPYGVMYGVSSGIGVEQGLSVYYPYIRQCDEDIKYGDICGKCPIDIDDTRCEGIKSGWFINENTQCTPKFIEGDIQPSTHPYCCPKEKRITKGRSDTKDSSCQKYSSNIFGYHTLQCGGGQIKGSEKEESAEFIVLKPNGDSVIDTSNFFGPLSLLSTSSAKNIIQNKFGNYDFVNAYPVKEGGNLIYSLSAKPLTHDFPFYCEIIPFENGNIWELITLSSESKIKLGYSGDTILPAFGISGVKVVKETDHELYKTEMHTQCELYWMFWGSGVVRSNVPSVHSSHYSEELIQKLILDKI